MSRIFMAWELGANYGHLSRLAPIATQLRQQGHEVMFAVRDTGVAAAVLAPQGFPFVQAPFWHGGDCLKSPPVNYAELLLAEGYHIPNGLSGMMGAWLSLFNLFAPDLVVADHSPTAIIAAHLAGLRVVVVDSGFGVPPDMSPLPSIRPWEIIPEQRLRYAETAVLKSINRCCKVLGGDGYRRLVDLFAINNVVFTNFGQLDHYGERANANYVGAIFGDVGQQTVSWQNGSGKKIFAYLRPGMSGLDSILRALSHADAEIICALPGSGKSVSAIGNLSIYPHPLRLSTLLPEADCVVSYSGSGMVAASLLAGSPLLCIPQNVEQYLQGKRVAELGAGVCLEGVGSESNIRKCLSRIFAEPHFDIAAKRFSQTYADFHPSQAIAKVTQTILQALNNDRNNRGNK